jgi:transcriptional regulator with XRE-family HTH domain
MGFGYLIKDARRKRGWSITQLAERLDVGRGYVGQLETDRVQRPRPEILQRIEEVLGVSREDIARAGGFLGPDVKLDPFAEFKRLAALPTDEDRYEALLRLPPDVVQALGTIAETMLRRGYDPPSR